MSELIHMTNFQMVKEFHQTFGVTDSKIPVLLDQETMDLRKKLIDEEVKETYEAMYEKKDIAEIAKELADILYVVYGTAASYGIDIDKVFAEVHRSNMSKLTKDGKVLRREDGKVLKSDQYTPADVKKVLFG